MSSLQYNKAVFMGSRFSLSKLVTLESSSLQMCTFCDSHNRASILAKVANLHLHYNKYFLPAVFCQNMDINKIYTGGFVIQSYGQPITALFHSSCSHQLLVIPAAVSCPDHTKNFRPVPAVKLLGIMLRKIDVGPPLFTLLQLEMSKDGVRTGPCDRPLMLQPHQIFCPVPVVK